MCKPISDTWGDKPGPKPAASPAAMSSERLGAPPNEAGAKAGQLLLNLVNNKEDTTSESDLEMHSGSWCLREVSVEYEPMFFWSEIFGWCIWVEKLMLHFLLHFSSQMLLEEVPAPQGAGAALLQQLKGGGKKADPQGTKKSSKVKLIQWYSMNIDIIDTLVGPNPRTSWYCRYLILYSMWLYALLAPACKTHIFFCDRSQRPRSGHGSPAAGWWIPSCATKNVTYPPEN